MSEEGHIERLNAALEGRYRIERELGEGGMATVYLADDLRHERKVALKVLKPELAAVVGAERFLAEIKTTANLQHPHILPLFDSGEADGFLFYVMPWVEGESLRERLDRDHQLGVDEAVGIASKVAGALQAAHERGVIHRDIKPANILLSKGEPLVSDFGIALAVSAGGGHRLTETGLSLGTPHYMSPEQATGDLSVGVASDIYALGCVLYEMLVGEPPYTGSTPQAILGKIIQAKPVSATEARQTVPANVDAVIRRALEKVPADRFRTASELVSALGDPGFGAGAAVAPDPVAKGRVPASLPWVGVALLSALLLWSTVIDRSATSPIVRHLNVALPDSLPLIFVGESPYGIGQNSLALSPDGTKLVYVGPAGSTTRLYLHAMDGSPVRALAGTDSAYAPFFSPDGTEVGFFNRRHLSKVTLDGQAQPLYDIQDAFGASWSTDGRIAFTHNEGQELMIVSSTGNRVASHATGFFGMTVYPHWIPGTEWILLTCYEPKQICVISAETGELRSLRNDGSPPGVGLTEDEILAGTNPRYVAPGYLVYVAKSRNSVLAVPFDVRSLTVRGEPELMLEGVRREAIAGAMQLATSRDGDVLFASGANTEVGQLVWADRSGRLDTLHFAPPRAYGDFFLSPDREKLAIKVYPEVGPAQLWFMDLVRGQETQWVDAGVAGGREIWSGPWLPTSDAVVAQTSGDVSQLLRIDAARASGAQVLWDGAMHVVPEAVSPDGTLLLSVGRQDDIGWYLTLVPLDSIGKMPEQAGEGVPALVDGVGVQGLANYSPDGSWVTYTDDESGTLQAYAVRLPATDAPVRLSVDGGELPIWAPQGDGLYYRNGRRWYWVPVDESADRPFGTPELFLSGDFLNVAGAEHAVSADGTRLLLLQPEGNPSTGSLDFVVGWRSELAATLNGAGR